MRRVLSDVSLFAQISAYIESLVHASARRDPLTAARHRAFIAPRVIGGLLALTALPVHLAVNGAPSHLEAFIYAWLATPVLIAFYLSRTGHYSRAQIMSSASLAALVTAIGAATGGISSFAAVWLVVIPIEAALAASRRVVMVASAIALGAAILLYLGQLSEVFATVPTTAMLEISGILSAALYATGLALGNASLARASSRLLIVEEDRYRLLARNIADVITRHRRNGMVRFASPAAELLFGVPAKSLLGHGLFDRVHVADRPAYLTALADAASDGVSSSVEFRVRRDALPDQSEMPAQFIWVDMRCRPLDQIDGESADGEREVVAAIRDVTDRKVQEQAVESAREEAERANAAKSRFLATMSHELRTPLNAIIGFSEMLANEEMMQLDTAAPARIRDADRRVRSSSAVGRQRHPRHVEDRVRQFRDHARAVRARAGDRHLLRSDGAARARSRHRSGLLGVPPDLPDIVADKRAVKQILINLLSNAVKFTQRGGKVVVTGEVSGADVILRVEDTGVGIGEDDLRHVGDPFFQARTAYDRPHDGTGLGLSIVKGLVELHGGELGIESRVGSGTSVSVRLPIDCEKARVSEPSPNVRRLPTAELADDFRLEDEKTCLSER